MAKASPKTTDRAPARTAFIAVDVVNAAKPEATEYVIWDEGKKDVVKGFGLKVTPAGAKVYIYRYRPTAPGEAASKIAPRKVTLGRHGAVTPDQARRHAKALAADVAKGIDPLQAKADAHAAILEAQRITDERARVEGELAFSKLAPKFLDWYENTKGRRASSVSMARLVITRYLAPVLADKPVPHITRADLQPVFDAIPAQKKGMARAVFAYASTLFSWAMKERGIITENPLRSMAKPDAPDARDTVLADDEVADLWRSTDKLIKPFGSLFRLLVLTGQRRSEVAGMMWGELDRDAATWNIPASRAKNKTDHLVPLSAAVIAEIDGLALAQQVKAKNSEPDATKWPKAGNVLTTNGHTAISGFSKVKAALDLAMANARASSDKPAPIKPWRIHDLRRTVATGFQRLGVRFEVTEAVLSHISGSKSGVAGIYQKHDWKAEKRTALDAWARHVVAITADEADTDNVVAIGTARKSTS